MTATDELRRLLDELRKLVCDINEEEIRSHSVITLNQGRYNRQFRLDMNHDWLNAWHAELECILKAVEATLGRGECRAVSMRERDKRPYLNDEQVCSECGCQLAHEFGDVWQNYCPNCGRKVKR